MGTKNNPGAFDCYANAEPDEPMFVLLGRDPTSAALVALWIALRVHGLGESEEATKLEEARACAAALRQWARDHGKGDRLALIDGLVDGIMARAERNTQREIAALRAAIEDLEVCSSPERRMEIAGAALRRPARQG